MTRDLTTVLQASPAFEWDEDTVALVGEFLAESGDGLDEADATLLASEAGDEPDGEAVNGLFRTFHTIKGVAGFMELDQVATLAHRTESLLNRVREGELRFQGPVRDLVFDSTGAMRTLMDLIEGAVERGCAVPPWPETQELIRRLDEAVAATATEAAPEPATATKATPEPATATAAPTATEAETLTETETETAAPAAPAPAPAPSAAGAPAPTPTPTPTPTSVPAPKAAPRRHGAKLRETIKVDVERADTLVETIGELSIVTSMLLGAPEVHQFGSPELRRSLARLGKISRDLQDIGMRVRMIPVQGLFRKTARMVRDFGKLAGKQVRVELEGEDVEMDRSMVERLADPLVHMVRNAVDHGIEPPERRLEAGKDPVGTVHISAKHEGGSVVVELRDDGGGLDTQAIARKATQRGLIRPGQTLSEAEIRMLIFAPGFSTAAKVTAISGRGVGMDVVKRQVEAMRGRLSVTSEPERGTSFRMILPLTLALIDAMHIRCGSQRILLPTLSIAESFVPGPAACHQLADGRELVELRGEPLPLLRLGTLLAIPDAVTDPAQGLVVVLEALGGRVGLLVDDVVTQQQVVIRSLDGAVGKLPYLSGAAILADGAVGLILNADTLAGACHAGGQGGPSPCAANARPVTPQSANRQPANPQPTGVAA